SASDFDVSFNGYATREQQPHLSRLPLLIPCFPEEEPITASMPLKVFLFEPARVFIRVSSSGPLPQTIEDCVINAIELAFAHRVPMIVCPTSYLGVEFPNQVSGRHPNSVALIVLRIPSKKVLMFFLDGLMSSFPLGYLRTFCPRKSKPFVTCVMIVFVGESSSPRSCRNCSTRGWIPPSSNSFDLPVMTKSSA